MSDVAKPNQVQTQKGRDNEEQEEPNSPTTAETPGVLTVNSFQLRVRSSSLKATSDGGRNIEGKDDQKRAQ